MRYENKSTPRKAESELQVPNKPGFYWAKWQICEDGTENEEHFQPTNLWTVVEVTNSFGMDTPFDFVVDVPGYGKWQSLDNFIWAKPIKPLVPPGA